MLATEDRGKPEAVEAGFATRQEDGLQSRPPTLEEIYGEGGPLTDAADLALLLEMFGTRLLQPETTEEEILAELRTSPRLAHIADRLVQQAQFQIAEADREQEQIAIENKDADRKHVEGLGELKATIHPRRMNELCARYGPAWFRDPATLRDTLERHPEMKATSTSRHIRVAVDGRGQRREDRGQKTEDGYVVRDHRCAADLASDLCPLISDQSGEGHGVQGDPATASAGGPERDTAHSVAHATASPEVPRRRPDARRPGLEPGETARRTEATAAADGWQSRPPGGE